MTDAQIDQLRQFIEALPPWRQELLLMTGVLINDAAHRVDAFEFVNRLTPGDTPKDIEPFRVALMRFRRLARRIATGSLADGREYSREVAEIQEYVEQQCAECGIAID